MSNSIHENLFKCVVHLIYYYRFDFFYSNFSHRTRFGIDVGKIDIVVHACPMIGRQYVYSAQGKMTLEKQWNDNPIAFAYQVVLRDITVHNPDFIQFTSITEVFIPKSICFMLGHPYYGARGEVRSALFFS